MIPSTDYSISVLIPAFDAARFFPEAIESVLAQTHKDFQLILINDGSTDETLNIATRYAKQDPRIQVITHPNMGMGAALNNAMQQATGTWIARLDADDRMLPTRLEKQIQFLKQNPDLKVASSTVQYIDDTGRTIGQYASAFITREEMKRAQKNHEPIGFHHPATIFHKQTIQELGGYRPQFWPADDLDLWNRVADAGHGVLVQNEPLTAYRIHASSVMVSKSRTAERKVQWATACIRARHQNQPEPTEQQFLQQLQNQPLLQKLNNTRRDLGRALYKSAVHHYSTRNYAKFLPLLTTAAALEPIYVYRRIAPQFRRKRNAANLVPSPGTPGEG